MTNPGFNMFQYAIEQYCSIVGTVNISEWDIKARDSYDGSDEAKEEEYQKQYLRYKLLAMILKKGIQEQEFKVSGITFWGTTDKYSWLQNTSTWAAAARRREASVLCSLMRTVRSSRRFTLSQKNRFWRINR